jgi:hypothetical protein
MLRFREFALSPKRTGFPTLARVGVPQPVGRSRGQRQEAHGERAQGQHRQRQMVLSLQPGQTPVEQRTGQRSEQEAGTAQLEQLCALLEQGPADQHQQAAPGRKRIGRNLGE